MEGSNIHRKLTRSQTREGEFPPLNRKRNSRYSRPRVPTTPAQFHFFPKLPVEIRHKIWRFVPRPTRIIGQIPCIECLNARLWRYSRWITAQDHIDEEHPDWRVRYMVVSPRGSELFGPLQACSESRQLWIGDYDYIGHYIDMEGLRGIGTHGRDNIPHKIRVEVPFICYETDVFTVFKAWNPGHTSDMPQSSNYWQWWDPFFGLDRSRIQHAGLRVWDEPRILDDTVTSIGIDDLPALQTFSFIMLGPDPGLVGGTRPGWVQMSPLVLQRDFDFELRDISPNQLENHPMFMDYIISKVSTTAEADTPFKILVLWIMAWLWHYLHCDSEQMYHAVEIGDLGADYMVTKEWEEKRCPLPLEGCSEGETGHTRKDIWDWIPTVKFELKLRFLCEREWLEDLERVGLFDEERTNAGDLAAFYRLREEEIDRPTLFTAQELVRGIIERKVTPRWRPVWNNHTRTWPIPLGIEISRLLRLYARHPELAHIPV